MFAFAGIRRHPLNPVVDEDDKNFLIEQLSKFIEEQARMKFQQQFHQRQHVPQEIAGPGFSFLMPTLTKAEFNRQQNSPIEFAVPPFDSRYYEPSDDAVDEAGDNIVSESLGEPERADYKNKILIPPPMHVNDVGTTDKILHRGQNKLAAKAIQAQQDVVQKPMQMEFDNTTSLYMVALIAGLSCAFSTGVSVPVRKKFSSAAFLMIPLFFPTHTHT